ncbi:MAG: helix-turn-helix transcriptional regulator [Sedimentisphaerales bacterium]|nr:helix-turn-helix transcriptional regulator [Sedimentisphaerales bacterium]
MASKNRQKWQIFNPNIELPDYGVLVESRLERPSSANIAHRHNHLSILYVVSGHGLLEFADDSFDVDANSVITLEKDKVHRLSDKPRKPMTVYSLYFDTESSDLNKYIVDYLFARPEPFELPLYYSENIKRHLRQMLHEQNTRQAGYKLSIKQNLSLAILQMHRAKQYQIKHKTSDEPVNSSERVKATIHFIAQNCHEQYSLSDAARLAKVSQRQFTNLCRKLTGKSYIKLLNSIRCQKAAAMLTDTVMPPAAIAFEVGYEDLSTFYRAFKREYKSSPMQFKTANI